MNFFQGVMDFLLSSLTRQDTMVNNGRVGTITMMPTRTYAAGPQKPVAVTYVHPSLTIPPVMTVVSHPVPSQVATFWDLQHPSRMLSAFLLFLVVFFFLGLVFELIRLLFKGQGRLSQETSVLSASIKSAVACLAQQQQVITKFAKPMADIDEILPGVLRLVSSLTDKVTGHLSLITELKSEVSGISRDSAINQASFASKLSLLSSQLEKLSEQFAPLSERVEELCKLSQGFEPLSKRFSSLAVEVEKHQRLSKAFEHVSVRVKQLAQAQAQAPSPEAVLECVTAALPRLVEKPVVPTLEEIVSNTLSRLPSPTTPPTLDEIVAAVLSRLPTPPAPVNPPTVPTVDEIVAAVLARLPSLPPPPPTTAELAPSTMTAILDAVRREFKTPTADMSAVDDLRAEFDSLRDKTHKVIDRQGNAMGRLNNEHRKLKQALEKKGLDFNLVSVSAGADSSAAGPSAGAEPRAPTETTAGPSSPTAVGGNDPFPHASQLSMSGAILAPGSGAGADGSAKKKKTPKGVEQQ